MSSESPISIKNNFKVLLSVREFVWIQNAFLDFFMPEPVFCVIHCTNSRS